MRSVNICGSITAAWRITHRPGTLAGCHSLVARARSDAEDPPERILAIAGGFGIAGGVSCYGVECGGGVVGTEVWIWRRGLLTGTQDEHDGGIGSEDVGA